MIYLEEEQEVQVQASHFHRLVLDNLSIIQAEAGRDTNIEKNSMNTFKIKDKGHRQQEAKIRDHR